MVHVEGGDGLVALGVAGLAGGEPLEELVALAGLGAPGVGAVDHRRFGVGVGIAVGIGVCVRVGICIGVGVAVGVGVGVGVAAHSGVGPGVVLVAAGEHGQGEGQGEWENENGGAHGSSVRTMAILPDGARRCKECLSSAC